MIIGWIAMLIFTGHACTHMVAAGDTWVAMACGRHFVNHGVDTIEPFSANSHKPGPTLQETETWPGWAQWITEKVGLETVKKWHPTGWVNQNWLTHVIFYSLIPKSSYADGVSFSSNALVYWKFAIYIVTVVCVFYMGIVLGVNPALSAVFSCFAMFIGRSFLDIRPAGFSNVLVAVFLLILVLATYRNILYIWLIVPVATFWCNVHGGYIYVFIMLVPFIGVHFLTNFSKQKFVSIGAKGIYHTMGAGFAAFLATIIFNPFHLTNLTHTFVVSVSEHAKRWRDIHEWHRAFEWTNPVGTAVPFAFMYGMALLGLVAWAAVLITTSGSVGHYAKRKADSNRGHQWPKIDAPLLIIVALTIYMAIRSRRFIPIAAIAACPIIAMFIDQMVRAIAATYSFRRHNRLEVPPMPQTVRWVCIFLGGLAVAFFGTWWGLRFKHVYLDAWPNDAKLTSVFMRMTASDAKPFFALKFIKDNKLKGKMFNYWTEGGAIAFGQEPDPNTGFTPLQLFMDGRAQAAYDRPAFDRWTVITAGGPPVREAAARARALGKGLNQVLTSKEYIEIGKWVGAQLGSRNVWVVLMPAGQFTKPFTRGLEHNQDWPVVFLNNKQKLFVDIRTPQGRELYSGIFSGKTLYPDDFHRNLIMGHSYLLQAGKNYKKQGLDLVARAFRAKPSPAPMLEIIILAARNRELIPQITKICTEWVDNFNKNQKALANQHGYRLKLEATRLACVHLEKMARQRKDTKGAAKYLAQMREYVRERNRISQSKRW